MIWLWVGFIVFVVILLVLDLTVVHGKAAVVSARSALKWVAFFVVLALLFNVAIYFIYERDWLGFGTNFVEQIRHFEAQRLHMAGRITHDQVAAWRPQPGSPIAETIATPGRSAAIMFLTGWLTEYSLSIDNIFVIAVIFGHFAVPPKHQHRVLFWGILGALVLRGIMIVGGTALIGRFHWLLYVFGAFLIYTAIKLALAREGQDEEFENRRIIRWTRKIIPLSPAYDGRRFITRLTDGRRAATPLLLVLIIVEATDLVFALDSIPAILGITSDSFLVFTSNVFAVLGLRSLFFALSGMMSKFRFLKYSLAVILGFIGAKMLLEMPMFDIVISSPVSLAVIAVSIAAGVAASLIGAPKTSEGG